MRFCCYVNRCCNELLILLNEMNNNQICSKRSMKYFTANKSVLSKKQPDVLRDFRLQLLFQQHPPYGAGMLFMMPVLKQILPE